MICSVSNVTSIRSGGHQYWEGSKSEWNRTWAGGGLWAVAHSRQAQRALLQEDVDLVERAMRGDDLQEPDKYAG